jgi:hypothetical protein
MSDPPLHDQYASTDLAAGVSYAYTATAGDRSLLVFTAGACPLDGSGSTVAPGDVAAQAEAVMANLRRALQAAGAHLDDVVKTTRLCGEQQSLRPGDRLACCPRPFRITRAAIDSAGSECPGIPRSAGRGGGHRGRGLLREEIPAGVSICDAAVRIDGDRRRWAGVAK